MHVQDSNLERVSVKILADAPNYPGMHFLPNTCIAQTDGLETEFNHPELQIVVHLKHDTLNGILHVLTSMIAQGMAIHPGVLVGGILADQSVRFVETELEGKKVYRVIVPDQNDRWPDDPECEVPYKYQTLPINRIWHTK